jgi:hypothetical protein
MAHTFQMKHSMATNIIHIHIQEGHTAVHTTSESITGYRLTMKAYAYIVLGLVVLTTYIKAEDNSELTHRLNNNIFYKRHNDIKLYSQHWTITYQFEITELTSHLPKLIEQIHDYITAISEVSIFVDHLQAQKYENITTLYAQILGSQQQDLEILKNDFVKLQQELDQLHSLITTPYKGQRLKRSLIPQISGILEILTGTPSEATMAMIKARLQMVEDNQSAYNHDIQNSFTAINKTFLAARDNRNLIYKLDDINQQIFADLNNFSYQVEHLVNPGLQFLAHFSQNQENLSRLRSHYTKIAMLFRDKLLELKQILSTKLPYTHITPDKLNILLADIEEQLPSTLQLPLNINSETNLQYYYIISCGVHTEGRQLQVMCNIPLISTQNDYIIYKATAIPAPFLMPDGSSLIGKYKIENPYFAISVDRTKFAVLDKSNFEICAHQKTRFCDFKTPIFSIDIAENICSVSNFLANDGMGSSCEKIIFNKKISTPIVHHLDANKWVLLNSKPISFTQYCKLNEVNYFTSRSPIFHIELQPGCKIVSPELTLYSVQYSSSKFSVPHEHFNITHIDNFWQPIIQEIRLNKTLKLDRLSNLDKQWRSLNTVLTQIRHTPQHMDTISTFNLFDWFFVALMILTIFTVFELSRFLNICNRSKTKCGYLCPRGRSAKPEGIAGDSDSRISDHELESLNKDVED